jgi:hypothetical protein
MDSIASSTVDAVHGLKVMMANMNVILIAVITFGNADASSVGSPE